MRLDMRLFILLIVGFGLGRADAQETWRRTYGGYDVDEAKAVEVVDDGYVFLGSTGSFGIGGEAYLVRTDTNGELVWSRYIGGYGIDTGDDALVSGTDIFIVGSTTGTGSTYHGYLQKVESDGDIGWRRTYPGEGWEFFKSIDAHSSGYYIVGSSYSHPSGNEALLTIKVDVQGDTLWRRTLVYGNSVSGVKGLTTSDGGCISVGTTVSDPDPGQVIVVKYDGTGAEQWITVIGTTGEERVKGAALATDGGIVVIGSSNGFYDHRSMMLAKVGVSGDSLWMRGIGDQVGNWEATAIDERSDGGFAISGYTDAVGWGNIEGYLLLTDHEGYYQFGTTYGHLEDDPLHDVKVLDIGFILCGSTNSFGPGIQAVFAVRTGIDGLTENQQVIQTFDPVSVPTHHRSTFSFHPNPVTAGSVLNIKTNENTSLRFITLTDLSGRVVAQERCTGCNNYAVPQLARGVYHITVEFSDGIRTGQPLLID